MHLSELLCKMSEIVPAAQSTLSFLRCSGAVRISHLWRHAAAARRLMMMMITDSQNLSSCSKDEFVCGSSFTLSSYHSDNSDFYASGTKICTKLTCVFRLDRYRGWILHKKELLSPLRLDYRINCSSAAFIIIVIKVATRTDSPPTSSPPPPPFVAIIQFSMQPQPDTQLSFPAAAQVSPLPL